MVLVYLLGRYWGYFWCAFFLSPSWSSVSHTWNTLLSMALSLNVDAWSCLLSLRSNEKTDSLHTWWSIKRGTISWKMWKLDSVEARGSWHVWCGLEGIVCSAFCLSSQPVYCLFSRLLNYLCIRHWSVLFVALITNHGIVWYRWPVSALTVAVSQYSSQCRLNRVLRILRAVSRIDIVVIRGPSPVHILECCGYRGITTTG